MCILFGLMICQQQKNVDLGMAKTNYANFNDKHINDPIIKFGILKQALLF